MAMAVLSQASTTASLPLPTITLLLATSPLPGLVAILVAARACTAAVAVVALVDSGRAQAIPWLQAIALGIS